VEPISLSADPASIRAYAVIATLFVVFMLGFTTGYEVGWKRKCTFVYRKVREQVLDDVNAAWAVGKAKANAAARFGSEK
jgi:hypothetical protein